MLCMCGAFQASFRVGPRPRMPSSSQEERASEAVQYAAHCAQDGASLAMLRVMPMAGDEAACQTAAKRAGVAWSRKRSAGNIYDVLRGKAGDHFAMMGGDAMVADFTGAGGVDQAQVALAKFPAKWHLRTLLVLSSAESSVADRLEAIR